ncbi:BNR-4 repeat-containing protein [Pleomorphovibrio marinus]|uniref:BNR-4 repeat-containing protein n=1 Tax=Pleomorphovibrio marinus TaxID=2164132 RepID=UPI000E0C8DBB|nr:BNR-4 repeat-containing protein [Pleomorphovibrio marinus]
MTEKKYLISFFLVLFLVYVSCAQSLNNTKHDGYRGIWFTLGQQSDDYEGDKYSGGLAFCFSHTLTPMAIYSPEVDKTFFVYGGTTEADDNHLLIMASFYDHAKHQVPRPTIVRDQLGVIDPHDNPSISIDEEGYVWVFIAGRGRNRPGQIFKATAPYSVEEFKEIISREQTYSQIWNLPGQGFLHLMTMYTAGRELYMETSEKGDDWTSQPDKDLQKLVGFGGHYQVSRLDESKQKVGSAFNYHPDGSVDKRTNVYYMETKDFGETWTNIHGEELSLPLDHRDNPALAVDFEAEGRLAYITKLLFDKDGNPVVLAVTSNGFAPGPENDPRKWEIIHWTGKEWETREITRSDHNYDMGSLYIDGDKWTLIGPALPGPQPYYTGGEVGRWISEDNGRNWEFGGPVTQNSERNHSYLRRPHNPKDPFFGMWADGDSKEFSISYIYFTNSSGSEVYRLPYNMEEDLQAPQLVHSK